MFSQATIKPTTLIAGCSWAKASKVPNTLAAPHISNFISSMPGPGLREMPPVSKVMPLPTNTVGAWASAAPLYFKTINRRGWAEACATAAKEPMPSLVTSFNPITSQDMRECLAMLFATWAKCSGVAWLAGRLPHSRASATPAICALAKSNCDLTALACGTPKVIFLKLNAFALGLVAV